MRKSTNRSTRATRKRGGNRIVKSEFVAPLAEIQGNGSQAMIPATLGESPNSRDAVIMVEVKRPGKPTRKRAAVIPIAVRKGASSRRRNESNQPERDNNSGQGDIRARERWSDPMTDSLITATRVIEAAIVLASHVGTTIIDLASNFSRILLSRLTSSAPMPEVTSFGLEPAQTEWRREPEAA